MDLSPTAARMLDTLPAYHRENVVVQRILQARANEIDRMDAQIDLLKQGLVPTEADDTLRLLSIWEAILGLPVAPPGIATSLRQQAVRMKLKALDAATAQDVLALASGFSIDRDTPALLEDTITIHFVEGTFQAASVLAIIQRAWPAHRQLVVHYDAGFTLDLSRLDLDTL